MSNKNRLFRIRTKKERGFALLEYCAGAAVILVIVWAALNTLGTNMTDLLDSIGTWATNRAGEIDSAQTMTK